MADFDALPEQETANVQVAVRVRPFNKREVQRQSRCCIRMAGNTTWIINPATLENKEEQQDKKTFAYDYSYWSFDDRKKYPGSEDGFAGQDKVFKDLGTVVLDNAFKGYNCSLMAYGQTGAGKSYSMMGGAEMSKQGLIPRICSALFSQSTKANEDNVSYKVEVSYLEIYSERIRDLLNPKKKTSGGLRVREHPETGPYVEDLTRCAVADFSELESLMSMGNKERTVAATNMNATSSRSHAVFTIVFTQTRYDSVTNMSTDRVSKLQLVDLAGSERVEHSGVTGKGLKEAANINKSLTTLGMVISALAKSGGKPASGSSKKPYIPFRNSVLTWLLKDSLGGNSKTIMIAAISPADINYDETLSTLRYAARAKKIVNKAVVNEDPNAKIIRALRAEVELLRSQLAMKEGSAEAHEEVVKLKDQLEQSKKIIADINKSWQEKLEETKQMQQERIQALRQQGISLTTRGNTPCLVNLNEDPMMSESLIYQLAEGTMHVGSSEAQLQGDQHMVLRGIGVQPQHCVFENNNGDVSVAPVDPQKLPEIYVNGELVINKRTLLHGDRVILGQHHVFRFSSPAQKGVRTSVISTSKSNTILRSPSAHGRSRSFTASSIESSMGRFEMRRPSPAIGAMLAPPSSHADWDFATRERTLTQGKMKGVVHEDVQQLAQAQLMEERMQMLESEKAEAGRLLEQQAVEYKALLAKYKKLTVDSDDDEYSDDDLLEERATLTVTNPDGTVSEVGKPPKHEKMPSLDLSGVHSENVEAKETSTSARKSKRRLSSRISQRNLPPELLQVQEMHEEQRKVQLSEELMKMLPLIDEANAICDSLGKYAVFEAELVTYAIDKNFEKTPQHLQTHLRTRSRYTFTVPANSPLARLRENKETVIQVRVYRGKTSAARARNRYSTWTQDEFVDKLFALRDIYNRVMEFGDEELQNGDDPLNSAELEDQFIGSACVYLAPLKYGVGIQQRTQILDTRGDYAGLLSVQVYCSDINLEDAEVGQMAETDVEENGAGRDPNAPIQEVPMPSRRRSTGSDDDDDILHRPPPMAIADVAGHFRTKAKITSQVPEENQPLPIVLRIAKVDRLPSAGIKEVYIKYRFGEEHDHCVTHNVKVTDVHTKVLLSPTARDVQVRSRRKPERLSQPLHVDYVMHHDVDDVTPDFLRALQSDAITFEVWGRFDTAYDANEDDDVSSPTKAAKDARRDAFKKVTVTDDVAATDSMHDRHRSANSVLSRGSSRSIVAREQKTEGCVLLCAVDLEEMDESMAYHACNIKEAKTGDVVFRVSSGSSRPKRFVISVVQCDSEEFILESCASCEVTSIISRAFASVDGDGTPPEEVEPEKRKGLPTLTNKGDAGMPMSVNIWEQQYQIHNKLITIMGHWPPEMTGKLLLRRPTAHGELIQIDLSIKLYLNRTTHPIELKTAVLVKAYDQSKTVSKVKHLFKNMLQSQGRLHRIGTYFRVLQEPAGQSAVSLFDQHNLQLSKLEHNMRIAQTQQFSSLVKILKSRHSSMAMEAQRAYDRSVDDVEPTTPQLKVDRTLSASSSVPDFYIHMVVQKASEEEIWTKRGYLQKRGKFHTHWKRRWFVLKPPHLYYYRRSRDDKEKGVIDLIGATVRLPNSKSSIKDPFAFEVHSLSRVWYLQAANQDDLDRWIEGILEFHDYAPK